MIIECPACKRDITPTAAVPGPSKYHRYAKALTLGYYNIEHVCSAQNYLRVWIRCYGPEALTLARKNGAFFILKNTTPAAADLEVFEAWYAQSSYKDEPCGVLIDDMHCAAADDPAAARDELERYSDETRKLIQPGAEGLLGVSAYPERNNACFERYCEVKDGK